MTANDAPRGGETIRPAIERFAAKCRFDATSGCVEWIGGKGKSRGGREPVGRFWDQGRMWNAHQWAAKNIHGLPVDTHTIHRTCRNPLCVEHLSATEGKNSNTQRFHWLGISKGFIEPDPERAADPDPFPFFLAPGWLKPFLPKMETNDAPF